MSVDDSGICFNDLWKTALERKNGQCQDIDTSDNGNTTRIRINAGDKDESFAADKAIDDVFAIRVCPPDFEIHKRHMVFYPSALGDWLEYELTLNVYSRVIQATGDTDASYDIRNICLENDMVTQPELARMVDNQYKGRLAILYHRVLRQRKMTMSSLTPSGTSALRCPPAACRAFKCSLRMLPRINPLLATLKPSITGK